MYNEMFADDRSVRGPYEKVAEWINAAGVDLLKLRQSEAEAIFRKWELDFAVIGEVTDWQGHSPEQLQTMHDHLARLKAQGIEAINE